jgi:predicted sugar kinase
MNVSSLSWVRYAVVHDLAVVLLRAGEDGVSVGAVEEAGFLVVLLAVGMPQKFFESEK